MPEFLHEEASNGLSAVMRVMALVGIQTVQNLVSIQAKIYFLANSTFEVGMKPIIIPRVAQHHQNEISFI